MNSIISKAKFKWNNIPLEAKSSIAYTACNIFLKSLSFITLPLFTRLLSTEEYGQATVYVSWSAFFSILLTLNLAYGSFSTAMIKFEDRRNQYIAALEGIFLLLSSVFCLVYLPFRNFWNRLLDLPTSLVLLLIIEILCSTAFQIWCGKQRFEFKYKKVIAFTLLIAISSPIMAYFFVINSDEKGYARIVGGTLIGIIIGISFFVYNGIKGKCLYNKDFWKYAFGFNIPLLPYYFSQMIFNQSDRIMINHFTGSSDAGMYGVAYNLAIILNFVLMAINNSYVPWYYQKIKSGKQIENRKVSCAISVLMAFLLLLVIWMAPEIIFILAGNEYYPATYVVPPIAMSVLLLLYTQLYTNILFYYEEKKFLVFASILAAIVNILLNILFIPIFGFYAAGYTTFISYILFAISNGILTNIVLKKHGVDESGINIKSLILIFILFTSIGFTGLALYNLRIIRIIIIAIILILIILFRKKVVLYLKSFKKEKLI